MPASAIAIKSSTVVGNIEKATVISVATRRSSSPIPLIPPTKSILLSVRGSPIAKIGASKLSYKMLTSSLATGSVSSMNSLFA